MHSTQRRSTCRFQGEYIHLSVSVSCLSFNTMQIPSTDDHPFICIRICSYHSDSTYSFQGEFIPLRRCSLCIQQTLIPQMFIHSSASVSVLSFNTTQIPHRSQGEFIPQLKCRGGLCIHHAQIPHTDSKVSSSNHLYRI